MRRNVIKNRNSLQITLPKGFAEALNIEKGDVVNVTLEGSKMVIALLET